MSKQAYVKEVGECGEWVYKPITLLPYCKRETEFGYTIEYQKVRRLLFGFIPITYWLNKRYIVFYDTPMTEYYTCTCEDEYNE